MNHLRLEDLVRSPGPVRALRMSRVTFDRLAPDAPPPLDAPTSTLIGLPVIFDEAVPPGSVEMYR